MTRRLAIVHHPDYRAPLRPGHPFPMSKYGYLRVALEARGMMRAGEWLAPAPLSEAAVCAGHDPDYVRRAFALALDPAEVRRLGLPMTPPVLRRSRLATAGTLLAARLALEYGIAANTAGGSHHAGRGFGAGYCLFNDVGIAATILLSEGRARRIAVVDCDAHQGDGTADIFRGDSRVFTASLHCEKNFPARKIPGSLDIGLPDGATDGAYLAALGAMLEAVCAAGPFDLWFYNAGVDVTQNDRLGRLALSPQGLRLRDRAVIDAARRAGAALAIVMGGGYSDDPEELAARHAVVFEEAALSVA